MDGRKLGKDNRLTRQKGERDENIRIYRQNRREKDKCIYQTRKSLILAILSKEKQPDNRSI